MASYGEIILGLKIWSVFLILEKSQIVIQWLQKGLGVGHVEIILILA